MNDTANLFSISTQELSTALTQRVIAAGGEVMQKTHTSTEAEYGRDALAKVMFFFFYNFLLYMYIYICKK